MKTFGKILFWLGVLSLILGIIGAVLTGSKWGSITSAMDSPQAISQNTSVAMKEGESRMLLGPSDGDANKCTVEGAKLEGAPTGAGSAGGEDTVLGVITADAAGDATISCTGSGYSLTGPMNLGDMMQFGLGILAAIILLPLGLLLMLIGGLLWFFGRKKDRDRHSTYTNGEYSDQFSRSAPYTDRGTQTAPPAPYASATDTDAGQPAYGEPIQGEPVREDRSFSNDGNFGRPLDDGRSVRTDGDFGRPLHEGEPLRDDLHGRGGATSADDQPWNGGSTPPPPPRGN